MFHCTVEKLPFKHEAACHTPQRRPTNQSRKANSVELPRKRGTLQELPKTLGNSFAGILSILELSLQI